MLLKKLFQRQVYIKPAGDAWEVVRLSILESFWDDLWRHGFEVALGNLTTEIALLLLK